MEVKLLQNEKGLVGREVGNALDHFRAGEEPQVPMARFRKKEPLETMPKSIVRHRLHTLTGRQSQELEAELGFSIKAGNTMSVEEARRLAHFLILEANGELPELGRKKPPLPPPQRKRPAPSEEVGDEIGPVPTSKRPRGRKSMSAVAAEVKDSDTLPPPRSVRSSGRRSLAPEAMRRATETSTSSTSLGCKLTPVKQRRSPKKVILEEVREEEEDAEDDVILSNPTPQMLAVTGKKRGSARKSVNATAGINRGTASRKVPQGASVESGIPGAPIGGDRNKRCKVFLATASNPSCLDGNALRQEIPSFTGANLTLVHTPAEWQPPEVFNVVRGVRTLNRDSGLGSFLVLVGCGVRNVHMFREALLRLTSHVQFVVVEREDQGEGVGDGKLRETTSFFLLAYFFPGSEVEGSILPEAMVRPGTTTCLRAADVEELEKAVVHALSEEGDWVVDLCCRGRELSLAAMKMGR